MTRNLTLLLIASVLVAFAGQAEARRLRAGDAVPFSHRPCSVLDGEPCTPSTCSVFDHGPCIPEIDYPNRAKPAGHRAESPPGDQQVLYRRPDHDLDTIGDLFASLRSCWSPPAPDVARAGMQMSVMFSFNTAGTPIAPPRVTFASKDAPQDTRGTYLKAINGSARCLLAAEADQGPRRRRSPAADHDPLCR